MFSFFKKKHPKNFEENIQVYLKKYQTYYAIGSLIGKIDEDQKMFCPQEVFHLYLQLKSDIEQKVEELKLHEELLETLLVEIEKTHSKLEQLIQMQEMRAPVRNLEAISTLERNLPGLKSAVDIKFSWF